MESVKDLVGLTMTSVSVEKSVYCDETIVFKTVDGDIYKMYHDQDCCEAVDLGSIEGDLNDLVGEPILFANEEQYCGETPPDFDGEYESYTWTLYTFRTVKGEVKVNWYGVSNGCYEESATFAKIFDTRI